MILHQHISKQGDVEAVGHTCKGFEKGVTVVFGMEYSLLFIPSRKDVIVSTFVFYPEWPCHGPQIVQAPANVNYRSIIKV